MSNTLNDAGDESSHPEIARTMKDMLIVAGDPITQICQQACESLDIPATIISSTADKKRLLEKLLGSISHSVDMIVYNEELLMNLPDIFKIRMAQIQGEDKQYIRYAQATGVLGYRMSLGLQKYIDLAGYNEIVSGEYSINKRKILLSELGVTSLFPNDIWISVLNLKGLVFDPYVFAEGLNMALMYVLKEDPIHIQK